VGSAIKGFRKGMQDGDGDAQPQLKADPPPAPQSANERKSEHAE
jgi:sec-independent protein translocase protein TatA